MGRLTIIIIALLIYFFNSCTDKRQDYEQKVYNDIITKLISLNSYYRPAPPPGLILKNLTPAEYNELKKEYDSVLKKYYQKTDMLKRYLFVKDTLQAIYLEGFKDNLNQKIEHESFTQYTKPKKPFKVDNLNANDIKLISTNYLSNDSLINAIGIKEDGFYIGYIALSRVIFNDTYTKGVLVCSFYCGRKCGERMLIMVSNKNNKWEINEKIILEKL